MGWLLGTFILVLVLWWWGRRSLGGRAPAAAPPALDASAAIDVVEIGDTLDLHGVPPPDVIGLVDEFLEASRHAGRRHVRIVHGKGIGVLRRTVRARLAQHPHVLAYGDAPPPSGWGATVVELDTAVARPRPTH